MIAKHYGKNYTLQSLRNRSYITREGVALLGISDAVEGIDFRTIGVKAPFEKLERENVRLFIVHWRQVHFVVVYKLTKDRIYVAVPTKGKITYIKGELR